MWLACLYMYEYVHKVFLSAHLEFTKGQILYYASHDRSHKGLLAAEYSSVLILSVSVQYNASFLQKNEGLFC